MKKLFDGLSSSRFFGKMSSALAFAVLAFGLATVSAWAWPGLGSTGGNFDDSLICSYSFNNSVTPTGPAYTYTSDGTGQCTWTAPQPGKKPPITETTACTVHFAWPVTSSGCVVDDDPNNVGGFKVTYTGHCQSGPLPVRIGYVSCPGAGFCAGTDCQWNQGFGIRGKGSTVTGMTASQCTSFENAIGGPAFEYTEHFTNATCSGIPVKIDDADWQAGHSHSWNSSNEPYVETDRKGNIIVANNATTVETGFIGPVDLDIQPASFDSSCTQQITARISSVPNDPDTETEVPIDVTQIDVNTMRVNGVPVVPSTCNLDQSAVPRLSCSLPSCVDGVPVGEIDGSQIHFMATGELFNGGLWASDTETKPFTP